MQLAAKTRFAEKKTPPKEWCCWLFSRYKSCLTLLPLPGLQPAELLCPRGSPGKNTRMGCHFLLQGIFLTQGSNPSLWHCRQILYCRSHSFSSVQLLSCVRLFATSRTVARQAPLSMGFPRQEYWNGLPFPSPGDLPNPGIGPRSPAVQVDSLPTVTREAQRQRIVIK